MSAYIEKHLPKGETILFSAKTHWLRYVKPFLKWAVPLGVGAGFMFYDFTKIDPGLAGINDVGMYVFLGFLAVSAWFLIKFLWLIVNDSFIEMAATENFVLYKNGFFKKQMTSLGINHVELVEVKQNMFQSAMKYGDIKVVSNGHSFAKYRGVFDPVAFRNCILEKS